MFNYFDYFNKGFIFGTSTNKYNPYINYSWSQTLTVDGNQQIKDTGTAGLNLQQYFGQGCWFNGIDMQVAIPVNAIIQTEIKRVNGVVEINTNTQSLNNYNVYSGTGAKVYKDVYLFSRQLSQTEIDKYNNQPNQFFTDSLEDSSCVLAMPMCEKGNQVRNYKNNTNYPISNYTTTCRTNAQRLLYGLQTSGFKRDTNGMILSKSNFLESDGVGYGNTGWIADTTKDFTIECVFYRPLNTADNIFGIGLGLASDIRFRVDSIFSFSFGNPNKTINYPSSVGAHLVTINYTASSKTYSMYINGVFVGSRSGSEIVNSTLTIGLLSNTRGTISPSSNNAQARLFKVHQKALTQTEVTKNFNQYQSQGLLNE